MIGNAAVLLLFVGAILGLFAVLAWISDLIANHLGRLTLDAACTCRKGALDPFCPKHGRLSDEEAA